MSLIAPAKKTRLTAHTGASYKLSGVILIKGQKKRKNKGGERSVAPGGGDPVVPMCGVEGGGGGAVLVGRRGVGRKREG